LATIREKDIQLIGKLEVQYNDDFVDVAKEFILRHPQDYNRNHTKFTQEH
jgi:hypothetical protein